MKKELYIDGVIGQEPTDNNKSGFTLKMLDTFLTGLSSDVKELDVYINSGGGDPFEALTIYDKLKASNLKVRTIQNGLVGSAATIILLAGTDRDGYKNSDTFIHFPAWEAHGGERINSNDAIQMANDLKKWDKKMMDFYVQHTGSTEAKLKPLMDSETRLSVEQAKELGFITNIIGSDIQAYTKYKLVALYKPKKEKMKTKKFSDAIVALEKTFKETFAKIYPSKIVAMAADTKDGKKIYTNGEIADGAEVFSDEAMTAPLADGSYTLADGSTITVAGGKVTAIKAKQEDDKAIVAMKSENEKLKLEIDTLKKNSDEFKVTMEAEIKKIKAFVPSSVIDEPANPKKATSVSSIMAEISMRNNKK